MEIKEIPLGEVVEVLRGKNLSRIDLTDGGKYPVYSGGLNPIGFHNKFNRKRGMVKIICSGASSGFVSVPDVDFWSSSGCFVLNTNNDIDNRYFFHCLETKKEEIKDCRQTSGMPNLNRELFKKIVIPYTDKENRVRIVNVLDRFDKTIKLLEKEIELKKKQLTFFIEKSFELDGVGRIPMGSIGEFVNGKGIYKRHFVENGGQPCIHYGQIYSKLENYLYESLTSIGEDVAAKSMFAKTGDLIITTTGENLKDMCKSVLWCGEGDIAVSSGCCKFTQI